MHPTNLKNPIVAYLGSPRLTSSISKSVLLLILSTIAVIGSLKVTPAPQTLPHSSIVPNVPVQTDDGLDPITLVFTGYAPSWWVTSNIVGWSDSAYCSGPKTLRGNAYNYTLEHPDPSGIPCFGPRDHVRLWDMGYSPTFGQWSVGAAHREQTVCDPICHHVIDSWGKAEADVRSAFAGEQATQLVSNFTLGPAGYYQGVFNDGNATMIRLKPPSAQYPVVFNENGLTNATFWSMRMNGITKTSPGPDITFSEPNGTFVFSVVTPLGHESSASSGIITVNRSETHRTILFTVPWSTSSATVYSNDGKPVVIDFAGNATVAIPSVRLASNGTVGLNFSATEVGSRGVLNVTIPMSALPSGSSSLVYIDGARNLNTRITEGAIDYYVYFLLTYGTHFVELQFSPLAMSYLQYIGGGLFAASILGGLFMIFKMKKRGKNLNPNRGA